MIVKLEENYRRYYTLEDLDVAKKLIKFEREGDSFKPKELLKYAAEEALKDVNDYVCEVLTAKAETCRDNSTPFDYFFEGSGTFNIWISGIAKTYDGFIEVGALYSDICSAGNGYKHKMLIEYYKKVDKY